MPFIMLTTLMIILNKVKNGKKLVRLKENHYLCDDYRVSTKL